MKLSKRVIAAVLIIIGSSGAVYAYSKHGGWGMTPEYDGVHVIDSGGTAIGHIHLPERCANLCFGGRNRNRLFMSAAQSLFSLYVNTQGVAGG